jgi:ABC-type multidrug transport system ATPase subunit
MIRTFLVWISRLVSSSCGAYPNLTAWEFLDYQAIVKGLRDAAQRRQRIHAALAAMMTISRGKGSPIAGCRYFIPPG